MRQIKMTNLLEFFWRLVAASALLGLAACSPGTGGTGTGPIVGTLSYVGGKPAPTFSLGPAPSALCGDNCASVALVLEPERVELIASCQRFVYVGAWTTNAEGLTVLYGVLQTTTFVGKEPSTATEPAILRLQFSEGQADSRKVSLAVRNAAGNDLLRPLDLERGLANGAVGTCGP
jgi:hypothetical protein